MKRKTYMRFRLKSKGDLCGRFNDEENRSVETMRLNAFVKGLLGKTGYELGQMGRMLKARDVPLYRMYQHIMAGQDLRFREARGSVFEGVREKNGYCCLKKGAGFSS